MSTYIYTFIREDLSPEQKIVQLGHACHEAGKLLTPSEHIEPSNLVLLSARNEDDLLEIADKIHCTGITFSMFFEPDNNMGYSAICTRPVSSARERAFFQEWNLYRHAY